MKQGTPAQRKAFATALAARLVGHTRVWLGTEVAHIEGRPIPDRPEASVGRWLAGDDITAPDRVFAIEQALELAPGTLSRELGYLPVEALPITTTLEAISADNSITTSDREWLARLYRDMREAR